MKWPTDNVTKTIRTFALQQPKWSVDVSMAVTYTVEWVDTGFAHAFGYEHQGHYEITHWEVKIVKKDQDFLIDALDFPQPLYDVIDALCEKHLEENQPEGEE